MLNHQPIYFLGQVLKSSKGKLDEEIPEPYFLADASHHVKVVSKHIFSVVKKVRLSDVDAPKKIISDSIKNGGAR